MTEFNDELYEKPNQSSWWELFWKIFIGIIVWWIISGLLFIILTAIWKPLTEQASTTSTNPLLPLLLTIAWFFASFIWNLWVAWLYSLFFSKKYNKMS